MTDRRRKRNLYKWGQTAHSVWTTHGNSKAAEAAEGIPIRPTPFPHYNAPVSLSDDESPLVLPELARTVSIGVELACRIGARGERVDEAAAASLIESYHAFIAVRDSSHYEYAVRCSNFPHFGVEGDPTWDYDYEVVQAWADGFARISRESRPGRQGFPENCNMTLTLDGAATVSTNSREYVHRFTSVIQAITLFVCVDKGDVISLGRAGDVIVLPPDNRIPAGAMLSACVDGVGRLTIPVVDLRSDDNYYTRSIAGGAAGSFV